MAIIIETCPKCGHDLLNEVICTYPPIPRKSCPSCGWSWEGEREEVIRVPFGGNSLTVDDLVDICKDVNIEPSVLNNINSDNCLASTQYCNNACVDGTISAHSICYEDGKLYTVDT